ncbi:host attachment protein [Mesorhizobium sp. KR1-2]|uniref:host attachment protein n=1 Tax=Mesorhizobium sp. KR1-2 TaxID=3156609 RepID=UPI0032B4D9EC
MKPLRIWVLVADGSRARILRNAVTQERPAEPLEELVFTSPKKQLREIMADKPGRGFASAGGTRSSSMEYHSDPVHEEQQAFAAMLVSVLQEHLLAGDFDRLAIIAAPRMLGDLRQALPEGLRNITITEISKDLTRLGILELREAVSQMNFSQLKTG